MHYMHVQLKKDILVSYSVFDDFFGKKKIIWNKKKHCEIAIKMH